MKNLILTFVLFLLAVLPIYGQSPAFIEQVSDTHPLSNLTLQQRYSAVHQMQIGSYNRLIADINGTNNVVTQFQFGERNTSSVNSMFSNNIINTLQYGKDNNIDVDTKTSQNLNVGIYQIGFNHNASVKTNNSIQIHQFGRDQKIIVETY